MNFDFRHFMLLDEMNSMFSFKNRKKDFFSFCLLFSAEKFLRLPQQYCFARLSGRQPPSAPLARTPMEIKD